MLADEWPRTLERFLSIDSSIMSERLTRIVLGTAGGGGYEGLEVRFRGTFEAGMVSLSTPRSA